jgi:thiol-disulfide isomerase/thioredoxin
MSDQNPWASMKPRAAVGRGVSAAIVGCLGVGVAAALYVMGLAACKPQEQGSLAALAHGPMAKLEVPKTASGYPDAGFVDGDGKPVQLSDFRGQAVVLNLWATWCAPCVKEMPTLAALQKAYAGRGVKVIALSADSPTATDKAKAFIAAHPPLDFYQDKSMAVPSALTPPIQGFPTTYLYDRLGRLRGVYQGDTDWASPEARAVVAKLAE